MAENQETQRDVSAGMTDRNKTTYTAQAAAATKVGGATGFTNAAERDAIVDLANNNRTRLAEVIACLERMGLIEAA